MRQEAIVGVGPAQVKWGGVAEQKGKRGYLRAGRQDGFDQNVLTVSAAVPWKRLYAAARLRDGEELLAGFSPLLCRGRISCGPGRRRQTAPLQHEEWTPSREVPWKDG